MKMNNMINVLIHVNHHVHNQTDNLVQHSLVQKVAYVKVVIFELQMMLTVHVLNVTLIIVSNYNNNTGFIFSLSK